MKAHEVRLLRRCPVCGKLGDEQAMIKVGPMKTPAHDRCAFEQLGDGVVNLPRTFMRDLAKSRDLGWTVDGSRFRCLCNGKRRSNHLVRAVSKSAS